MENQLHNIAGALQETLESSLRTGSKVHNHPVAKGDATEENWLKMLKAHLPKRYEASKAIIIDSTGAMSDQIDIVIYDWQYTPILFNQDNQRYIPAESVYAVFEVKPTLKREYVIYAGGKIESVRRLHRTSAEITHAGGKYIPRSPFPIIGGILVYDSEWKPGLGDSFIRVLGELANAQRLDLGCAVIEGAFGINYSGDQVTLTTSEPSLSLIHFFFTLLAKLQCLGTVSAIDYSEYINSLGS